MTTPLPAPSIIKPLSDSTNTSPVSVAGKGTSGATLHIKVNVTKYSTTVNSAGDWQISVNLSPDDYLVSAFQERGDEISLPTPEVPFTVE